VNDFANYITITIISSYMNSINSNYEPELRYACTPSKEDIFKLLVNLHENRKGNHSKTVNFCNPHAVVIHRYRCFPNR